MWKPSPSEISNVVASEIESDSGSIEDLAHRLINQAQSARTSTPRDQWREALRDWTVWQAYVAEVDRQVSAIREARAAGTAYPPLVPMPSGPAAVPIAVRIVDTDNGGRALGLFRGRTVVWLGNVATLTADHIVEAASAIFRKDPAARVALDIATVPPVTWRVALLHILPLHRQSGATPADIIRFLNELIGNGKALADLGLDGGASEAWANPAGGAPQSFAVTECNRLNRVVGDLQAANRRLQDQLSGHTAGPVLTMCDKVTELREEVDELKRALELARAAVAAPPADAPSPASLPDLVDVYLSRLANAVTLLDHAKAHLVAARADAPAGTFDSNRLPAGMRVAKVDLLFDRGPCPRGPRLIEAEEDGESVEVGAWRAPGDGGDNRWRLQVQVLLPAGKDDGATG